jgi:hypothetical protein
MYNYLQIWVEGDDDRIFFENVIKAKLSSKYDEINIDVYCGDSFKNKSESEKIEKFIKSFDQMNKKKEFVYDYIFVADIDLMECVSSKKAVIKQILRNIDPDKILIVVKEIEGWYFAGTNDASQKKLKLKKCGNLDANNMSKEIFLKILPDNCEKIPKLLEMTEIFCFKEAMNKSNSFSYFFNKIDKYCSVL